ncbi:retrograde regulation protein 2 [Polychaeton citri CBS 116435]|uniref:Retrograde regulation protein 2 n=1 Tax=Polychaeton citri CBS 116435 TaxID=1314669 RepID=A0A9P4UML8_9PEZI|nr:retrograde regulation protein 2 [Polychaeton citri CBS 116435]
MAQYDAEKTEVVQLERITSDESTDSAVNDARINAFTPEEQKKIIRRIDRRLVLTCGFMYCVSLMDRTNTGIAVVAGMGVDLVLIGFRYSALVLVFFITYVLLQPPATVILRKVGPRIFLPTIVVLWGLTMMCFGFVRKWYELIPLRLILGVFEAGFFPGCAYLLSTWYPRYELQKRNAVFYLIGSLSSAFSGILAYGFFQMNGLGNLGKEYGQHYGPTKLHPDAPSGIMPGIAGWRWIFILQGVITIVVGFIGAITIVDFPEKAATKSHGFTIPFLNEKEAAFVVARIEKDRHDAIPEPFNISNYLRCACDSKIWGFAWLFGLTTTNTYAIAYFLPIILYDGMGFSLAMAECLIAPPYVFAAFVMFAVAWFGDKYHIRGPLVIFNALLGVIGLPLMGFASSNAVRYFGVFLATTSCNSNIPTVLSFQANNIRGQWKRALASATLVGAGGIGGIIGSTVFREQDKPTYHPGLYTCIIASVLVILITLLLDLKFWRANKRAAAGGKVIEGLQGFRYTL